MKKTLIIIALLLLTSCAKQAKQATQEGNFVIELLFEKDGCKMYRFYDAGRYIYWSNCEGKTQYKKNQNTGKSQYTKKIESITTID